MKKRSLAWPITLILIGAYWLLKSLDLFPGTTVMLSIILLALALVILLTDGLNKQSFVVCSMLTYTSITILIINHWQLPQSPFWASGMIFLGLLLLLTRSNLLQEKHNKPDDNTQ